MQVNPELMTLNQIDTSKSPTPMRKPTNDQETLEELVNQELVNKRILSDP
jgi:hypothetical protein